MTHIERTSLRRRSFIVGASATGLAFGYVAANGIGDAYPLQFPGVEMDKEGTPSFQRSASLLAARDSSTSDAHSCRSGFERHVLRADARPSAVSARI